MYKIRLSSAYLQPASLALWYRAGDRSLLHRRALNCSTSMCITSFETDNITPVKTVTDIISKLSDMVGVTSVSSNISVDRKQLLQLLPKTQDELPPRYMKDSWDRAFIPLSSDARLREKYVTHTGGVRMGRLLEDLDVFAVWLCYRHISLPSLDADPSQRSPYTVVTAMVDRMDFCKGVQLSPDTDIRLSGHVSWVGRSSIETTITVDQWQDSQWREVTRAFFVLVARDPLNQGPALVNHLVPVTDAEQRLFQQGELNRISRRRVQEESLFRQPPNETEKSLVHEIFMDLAEPLEHSFAPKRLPEGTRSMEDTKIKNIILCHPESQNIHGKIFGGFLMRQAFELSWINAHLFSGERARVRHIDNISFQRPVEVGSLLYLNSQVVYTDENYMQVSTKASMLEPATHTKHLTNIFHFTFASEQIVPRLLPRSYHEAMMFLDGRRHYQLVRGDRRYYGQQEVPEH